MKGKVDYQRVLSAAQSEAFCDVGHFHCPMLRADGAIVFDAGIVRPDGTFDGARRLYEVLLAPPLAVNLFTDGAELAGTYHYPHGSKCGISTLPEHP